MMDLLLYSSIRDYIYARISFFTEHVLSKNLTLVFTIIVALLTLWIMIQGYLIATGRSQEGLKGFVYGLGKTYLIVAVALGVAAGGDFSVRVLTDTLSDGISQIMTGDSDVGSKCLTQDSKSIIGWFVGVGTAGPAIVAGTMLIMFRIAMALFIGFAPIFILCLLFKKTAPLFQKWLYYGLATIFSSVMLGVMAEISMDLVGNIAITDAVSNIASALIGGNVGGIMQTVTQQLGLGLMLSTLLITVPPMAGAWFNGMMATYSGYNAMQGWGTGQPATPPGMNNQQQHASYNVQNKAGHSNYLQPDASQQTIWTTGGSQTGTTSTDAIKLTGQPGKGNTSS